MAFELSSNSKIVVGLSGGVDSAVSAYLLKQQGHEVLGLFMKNWDEDDTTEYCSAEADLKDVRQVCKTLDIALETINFSDEYWKHVFSYFLEEHQAGRTPNPDILCNQEIKFKYFLDYAKKLGADFIATGHYAQRASHPLGLNKAADLNKDQTYFLCALNAHQLSQSYFPLHGLLKSEVRQIAKKAGFENHAKKDSTGICFIGERKFNAFLAEYIPAKPGQIRTADGQVLGKHNGLMFYTLGQRKGIHLGGMKNFQEKPWYVIGKAIDENALIVSQTENDPWQFSTALIATDINWITPIEQTSFRCQAKTRYRQADQPCSVQRLENTLIVKFDFPQRAVTPGQSVVFYEGDRCLGGARIMGTNSPGGLWPKYPHCIRLPAFDFNVGATACL
ncbi:MAG: tRNA 2-thiouridine(34) synthase MnmA [Gammaproteobacteria bacterium]